MLDDDEFDDDNDDDDAELRDDELRGGDPAAEEAREQDRTISRS